MYFALQCRVAHLFSAWILPVGFTCVLWYAYRCQPYFSTDEARSSRMSMIFSIIRVGNPLGSNIYKQVTYSIAASFACMWIALLVLKLKACLHKSCPMAEAVALSQLLSQYLFRSLAAVSQPQQRTFSRTFLSWLPLCSFGRM